MTKTAFDVLAGDGADDGNHQDEGEDAEADDDQDAAQLEVGLVVLQAFGEVGFVVADAIGFEGFRGAEEIAGEEVIEHGHQDVDDTDCGTSNSSGQSASEEFHVFHSITKGASGHDEENADQGDQDGENHHDDAEQFLPAGSLGQVTFL